MFTFLSIVLATFLGWLLLVIGGPYFGAVIAFGIIAGCIFRGLYLLNLLVNELVDHE
ncbi:hypothetical protein GLW08_16085 [Pontibacillus yanchengensis]|uniref:Uncharacterized protein n=2 Tax=Pontibacillus yanchengensis TaxID=462910 RepID=A0ACC7VJQ9_9BACI|nr:hypothetical protein [Pontibacillus yanchengensis]MYL35245.1 hypothetical protein [Pontibacillus yanchengensis]MYL54855.1 hypothetical protein [Pontibacillus yanchengensis]